MRKPDVSFIQANRLSVADEPEAKVAGGAEVVDGDGFLSSHGRFS